MYQALFSPPTHESLGTRLRLEMDLGSVLESELGQNWRYGVLKAFIG